MENYYQQQLDETGRISHLWKNWEYHSASSEIAMSMNLAIEEIIANIQYISERKFSSQLQAHITPGRLTFQITDEGSRS